MGLLIVRGLAALFRCSGARFGHAIDSPALNECAIPVHQADTHARGVYVQPLRARPLPSQPGCGGFRSGCRSPMW
jgi:hypothetical protein